MSTAIQNAMNLDQIQEDYARAIGRAEAQLQNLLLELDPDSEEAKRVKTTQARIADAWEVYQGRK